MASAVVHITGFVGKDPEMKYSASGLAICTWSVAVKRFKGSGEGRQELTNWYRCATFGRQAENANQYVRKGMVCTAFGELIATAYSDKQAAPQPSLDLNVTHFEVSEKPERSEYSSESDGDIPF